MVNVDIDRDEVFAAAKETVAYIGAKRLGFEGVPEDICERVTPVDEDEAMLQRMWAECEVAAANEIGPFLDEVLSVARHDTRFVLRLGSNYAASLQPQVLKPLLTRYLTLGVAARWFALVFKSEAAELLTQAASVLAEFKRALLLRKRPEKPSNY